MKNSGEQTLQSRKGFQAAFILDIALFVAGARIGTRQRAYHPKRFSH
jgi:hypothetical protein